MGPRNPPHRQLRIVGDGRADAYNDGVDQGPQTVQMHQSAGPLMYFEWPDSVATRPSSDWPIWPTITQSSTVPFRSGPKTSAQARGEAAGAPCGICC